VFVMTDRKKEIIKNKILDLKVPNIEIGDVAEKTKFRGEIINNFTKTIYKGTFLNNVYYNNDIIVISKISNTLKTEPGIFYTHKFKLKVIFTKEELSFIEMSFDSLSEMEEAYKMFVLLAPTNFEDLKDLVSLVGNNSEKKELLISFRRALSSLTLYEGIETYDRVLKLMEHHFYNDINVHTPKFK